MSKTIQINCRAVPSATERNRLFDTYVEPNMTFIRRIVEQYTLDHYDADDNMQDVLLHLLHATAFFDPAVANITTWLQQVVTNKMRDLNRHFHSIADRWADSPLLSPDDADDDDACTLLPPSLITHPTISVPPLTINPDDYPHTYDALQKLSALQRRALLLSAEGWTNDDIAHELRMKKGSVATLLSRARATMRRLLADSGLSPTTQVSPTTQISPSSKLPFSQSAQTSPSPTQVSPSSAHPLSPTTQASPSTTQVSPSSALALSSLHIGKSATVSCASAQDGAPQRREGQPQKRKEALCN